MKTVLFNDIPFKINNEREDFLLFTLQEEVNNSIRAWNNNKCDLYHEQLLRIDGILLSMFYLDIISEPHKARDIVKIEIGYNPYME